MENLIRLESGEIALNPRISSQIAAFERAMKNLKEKEDALKTAILREMEAAGCIKIMTDDLTITYVAPTDRETFDSKGFRKAYPDLYDEFVSMSPVKASIRIKVIDHA